MSTGNIPFFSGHTVVSSSPKYSFLKHIGKKCVNFPLEKITRTHKCLLTLAVFFSKYVRPHPQKPRRSSPAHDSHNYDTSERHFISVSFSDDGFSGKIIRKDREIYLREKLFYSLPYLPNLFSNNRSLALCIMILKDFSPKISLPKRPNKPHLPPVLLATFFN